MKWSVPLRKYCHIIYIYIVYVNFPGRIGRKAQIVSSGLFLNPLVLGGRIPSRKLLWLVGLKLTLL